MLPELPVADADVIAQLLLDVVELCAEFANVAFEASLAMAASEVDRSDARGS